jgi:hypothetical protein
MSSTISKHKPIYENSIKMLIKIIESVIKEKIKISNIPYKVDVVDLSQVSESFRKQILKEGKILWKS